MANRNDMVENHIMESRERAEGTGRISAIGGKKTLALTARWRTHKYLEIIPGRKVRENI